MQNLWELYFCVASIFILNKDGDLYAGKDTDKNKTAQEETAYSSDEQTFTETIEKCRIKNIQGFEKG